MKNPKMKQILTPPPLSTYPPVAEIPIVPEVPETPPAPIAGAGSARPVQEAQQTATRAKTLLREIGIDTDIAACIQGIRKAKTPTEVTKYKTKLDALLKIITIHKTAADTANKNTILASADGTTYNEIKITLNRQ